MRVMGDGRRKDGTYHICAHLHLHRKRQMDIKGRTSSSSSSLGKKVAYEWIWIVEKTWWKYKSRRSAVQYVVTGTWRDRSGETWTSGSRDWSGSLIRAFMYYVGWHIPESRGMLHRLYVPHYTTVRPDPTHDANGNNRNRGEASSTQRHVSYVTISISFLTQ